MTDKLTYTEAFQELQLIVSQIETGETSVDELTEKIRRASSLISICKAKLSDSEEEVEKLLAKLAAQDQGDQAQVNEG